MIEQLQPYVLTVLQALMGLLVAMLLTGIAVMRKKAETWLESRTTAQQREILHKLAVEGAALIEATYEDAGGPAKLAGAFDYVSKRLHELGIEASSQTIQAAIEKAVQDFNAKTKGGGSQ